MYFADCWMLELQQWQLLSLQSFNTIHNNYIYYGSTFPVTGALAITVLAVKGESACYSAPLDSKCTLTVLWWTGIGDKGLGNGIQSGP